MKTLIPKMSFSRFAMFMDIEAAAHHARFLNDTLALARKSFNSQIEAKLHAIPPDSDYAAEAHEWYADNHDAINRRVPEAQWKAQFIYAMSVFEFTMQTVCREISPPEQARVELEGQEWNGLAGYKDFLTATIDIGVFGTAAWERILQLSKARNVIVHAGGTLNHRYQHLQDILRLQKKIPGLKVLDYNDASIDLNTKRKWIGRIVVDATFVMRSIELLRTFIESICDAPATYKVKQPASPRSRRRAK